MLLNGCSNHNYIKKSNIDKGIILPVGVSLHKLKENKHVIVFENFKKNKELEIAKKITESFCLKEKSKSKLNENYNKTSSKKIVIKFECKKENKKINEIKFSSKKKLILEEKNHIEYKKNNKEDKKYILLFISLIILIAFITLFKISDD